MTLTQNSPAWMGAAKEATPENAEIVAAVVELAESWRAGGIPLSAVRGLCSGYDRFVAMNHAKAKVSDLIDALVADQDRGEGSATTKQGRFTQRDLQEHGAWIYSDARGNRVIQFKGVDDDGRAFFRVIPDYKLDEGEQR